MPSLESDAGASSEGIWPAVRFEEVEWNPTVPLDLLTRRQRATYRGPHAAAVVPEIRHRVPTVPPEISLLAAEASSAITRFDTELGNEIAPFAAILLRSESASSSQIENLSSGAKQIALAELGSREKRNATAIVGNVAAMRAALALADGLDSSAILSMHKALLERHDPDIAGAWRTGQVWIGGSSIGPHDADFVAPMAARVPALIDDLVEFARRGDMAPLVLAAIAHAQFETIHPFPDGNGRTGRALLQAMLRAGGVTRNVTVPVSAGLLRDTAGYFEALHAYRSGDVAPIIAVVAAAAVSAVDNGGRLISDLHRIRFDWDERVRSRRGSAARRLLDVLLRQPVIDGSAAASALAISPANVGRAIAPLVDAGVLREFTGFNRNRMWQASDVIDALDAFAARAARRGP